MKNMNINVNAPNQLSDVLREAADAMRESRANLQAAWCDPNAGYVWEEIAKILDRAAASTDRAVKKYF